MIRDINDHKPWSQMDLRELRHALAWGESIQEAAHSLGRSGTLSEVKLKAKELGLLSKIQKRLLSVPEGCGYVHDLRQRVLAKESHRPMFRACGMSG